MMERTGEGRGKRTEEGGTNGGGGGLLLEGGEGSQEDRCGGLDFPRLNLKQGLTD